MVNFTVPLPFILVTTMKTHTNKWAYDYSPRVHFITYNFGDCCCIGMPHGIVGVFKGDNFRRAFMDGDDYEV